MPRTKKIIKSTVPSGERQRFEILLEEMRSQFRLVLEGLKTLEHRMERLEQQVNLLQSAILTSSTDLQGLRRDVRSLTERFEAHIKEHAST